MDPTNFAQKISVVIAGRNNAKFIDACLGSVFNQKLSPLEVIYLNDGSTDNTKTILEGLQKLHPQLKVAHTEGVGISKARNIGNSMASGEYIAILDSDDAFLPDAILEYSKQLMTHDSDLIYANCHYFSDTGRNLGVRNYPKFSNNKLFAWAILGLPQVPFKHSAVLYKKQLINKLGGYDETLRQKVDIELLLRFLLVGKISVSKLDFTVVKFIKHAGQVSNKRLTTLSIWYQLIKIFEPNPVLRIPFILIRSLSEAGKFALEKLRIT